MQISLFSTSSIPGEGKEERYERMDVVGQILPSFLVFCSKIGLERPHQIFIMTFLHLWLH